MEFIDTISRIQIGTSVTHSSYNEEKMVARIKKINSTNNPSDIFLKVKFQFKPGCQKLEHSNHELLRNRIRLSQFF